MIKAARRTGSFYRVAKGCPWEGKQNVRTRNLPQIYGGALSYGAKGSGLH